jgi:hypothetical protein
MVFICSELEVEAALKKGKRAKPQCPNNIQALPRFLVPTLAQQGSL